MNKATDFPSRTGLALAAGVALLASPSVAQIVGVTGLIVDQKGYRLRNVIVAVDGRYDTTDHEGRFGAGRDPVVGFRGQATKARLQDVVLAGPLLRFSGLGPAATLKAELRLASGRRAGPSLSLPAAGGRADLDLDALAAGLPREGLYLLRAEAGNGAEHYLLARMGGGAWALSSRAGASQAVPSAATALRKASAPAAMIRFTKPGYGSVEMDVPSGGDVGVITLKLDPAASEVEAPFDVAPLWYPTGWAGDHGAVKVADETTDIRAGDPDSKCARWTYAPDMSAQPVGWAAVLWQYPENNWGAKPGRRVTGASKITFWAKGATGGESVDFKSGSDTYVEPAEPGMWKDSYGAATTEVLTNEWKKYEIPLDGRNTTVVIAGFIWATTMGAEGAPVSFLIDEVRFE